MNEDIKKSVKISQDMWGKIEASMDWRGLDTFNSWARLAFMNEIRRTTKEQIPESNDAFKEFMTKMLAEFESKNSRGNKAE